MPIRELTYNESSRPHHQFPLREPKGKPTQERWIVAAWGKETFCLTMCWWQDGELLGGTAYTGECPYSMLWEVLAGIPCGVVKWWLIGHGTGYALDRANFTDALERGDVSLPKIAKGNNKGKHGGKLTLSRRITEVDIVCGKNKIKMLDWCNFAVESTSYSTITNEQYLQICIEKLREYLTITARLGVQVCKTTAAQLGWNKARADCLKHRLHINLDPACRALERRAYHAGRNECFALGRVRGTAFSLDVKSCYATICLDEALPIRMVEDYRHGCDIDKIDPSGDDHWIADVVVRTEMPDYPLRWQGTPIYPVGQFRTALPWPELARALRRSEILTVLRAARYESAPVLREYAQWYLRSRVELAGARSAMDAGFLKAMFNASLGYTARQKYEWQPWDTQIGFKYWIGVASNPEQRGRMMAGDGDACELEGDDCGPVSPSPVQAQKLDTERRWLRVDGEPREAMPFIHATVCSYARVLLLDIFNVAGRCNVIYCDTDGLLVTLDGFMHLTKQTGDERKLWFGLVQRFEPGRAFIQGQKSYRVGDQIIHAGVVDTRRSSLAVEEDAIAVNVDEDATPGQKNKRTVRVLTCKTGRPSLDGRVEPFRFDCHDTGDQNERWINVML